ncbi:MAG: O-antigen ligase family protein [Pirellulales bacterium]
MNRRNFKLEPPSIDRGVWIAAPLLSLALIGLVHDLGYATALGGDSAEAGRFFEGQAEFQSDVGSAATGRIFGFACLLLAGIYCALTVPRGRRFQWNALSLLIAMGLLWTLASVTWSVEPHHTLRELMRLFAYVFVAVMLALRFDPRSLCLVLIIGLGASIATAVSVEIMTGGFRPWVSDYRLSGSMHSGAVGSYSMLLVLAGYALARQRGGKMWWLVFVAGGTTLLLSKALAAFIATAVGLAAIRFMGMTKRSLALGACCSATLLAAALIASSATDFWSNFRSGRIDTMGRDFDFKSFNGRIPLWNVLWNASDGKRFEGFGYGGFWVSDQIETLNDELNWYASHAHSAYVGTMVHVGLVGLVLLIAIGLLALRCTIHRVRTPRTAESYVFASWLVVAFFIGIAETSFVEPRDLGLCSAAIVFSCVVSQQPAAARQSVARAAATLRSVHSSSPEGHFA